MAGFACGIQTGIPTAVITLRVHIPVPSRWRARRSASRTPPPPLLAGTGNWTSSNYHDDNRSRKQKKCKTEWNIKTIWTLCVVSWVHPCLKDRSQTFVGGHAKDFQREKFSAPPPFRPQISVPPYPPPGKKASIPQKIIYTQFSGGKISRIFLRAPISDVQNFKGKLFASGPLTIVCERSSQLK